MKLDLHYVKILSIFKGNLKFDFLQNLKQFTVNDSNLTTYLDVHN